MINVFMSLLFQSGRRQIILFIVIMAFLSQSAFITITWYMYKKHKRQQTIFLKYTVNMAKSVVESVLIEEINLRHRIIYERVFENIQGHLNMTKDAAQAFGDTGEVVIGYQKGDLIEFVFDPRFSGQVHPKSIGLDSLHLSGPMRKALLGESGIMTGLDYRGVRVLAVYESLPQIKLGIVGKIDLSELQKPFLYSIAYSFFLIIILFGATGVIIIRVGEHIITIHENRERERQAYIDFAPIGMIVCDQNGKFLEINNQASEILGYGKEELVNQSFGELMPDKVIKVHHGDSIINEMAQFFNVDRKFKNKLGEEFYLLISVIRLTKIRYMCFITDITALKQIENRLYESEEIFRGLFAAASDAIIMSDERGRVVLWNSGAEKIFGYSAKEAAYIKISELIIPEDYRKKHEDALLEFSQAGKGNRIGKTTEFITVNKAGQELPVEMSLGSIYLKEKWHAIAIIRDIKERKDTEAALHDSQTRLNISLETSGIGLWEWDIKNDLWTASTTYYTMLGYQPETGAGDRKFWLERTHPDERPIVIQKIADILSGKDTKYQYEARVLNADGAYRWVSVLGKVVESDVHWKPLRILGTRIDITERKQAEIALRKSKELIQTVIENTPVRIFWKDRDLSYLGCNILFAQDAGFAHPDDLIGKTDFEMGWKDQAELYRADDKATMETGQARLNYEEPQTTPDGKTNWLRTSKVPLRDENNEVIGILGLYEDITQEKIAAQAIIDNETKFRTLFESSKDAIFLLDQTGFIDCNVRTLELLKCKREDFIGKHPAQFLPVTQLNGKSSKALVDQIIMDVYDSNKIENNEFEWKVRSLDGTEFDGDITITTTKISGKKYIQVTVRDISERKQMESQLAQSSKMATLGEMATGVAHEINQPLTVIRMGAQLLERFSEKKQLTDEILKDQMGKFIRNIDRAAKIINHLRLFGRMSAEAISTFSIDEPIKNAIEMVENRIRQSSINLVLDLDKGSWFVIGEVSSIEQVLINILLNAADALLIGENENREISIQTKYLEDTKMVEINISNNGQKISDVILQKVFEPFFTTKPAGQGTGLGLSISYGIIQAHKGSISVSNTEYGPRFTIKLPAKGSYTAAV